MFTARLACLFAVALFGLVGAAGDAIAQTPTSTVVSASPNPGVVVSR